MVKLLEEIAHSIDEYCILPNYMPASCTPDKVSLEQTFFGLTFRFPLMMSPMSCFCNAENYDYPKIASKWGVFPVIHCNQPLEDQVKIIKEINKSKSDSPKGGIERLTNPKLISSKASLEEAINFAATHGYNVIPVVEIIEGLVSELPQNYFHGVFVMPFEKSFESGLGEKVIELREPLYYSKEKLKLGKPEMSDEQIKSELLELKQKGSRQNFLPIVDEKGILKELVFERKYQSYLFGAAIHTHRGWQELADACVSSGADMLFIDSSHGFSQHSIETAKELKQRYPNIPVVSANIVTTEEFDIYKEHVDMVRVGLGTGSSCSTGAVVGVWRPLPAALFEIKDARDKYYKQTGKYIPIIADGGVDVTFKFGQTYCYQLINALAISDFVMCGSYFARFYECPTRAFDADKRPLDKPKENEIRYKEMWGEASEKGRSMPRYGKYTSKAFLIEGVEGLVRYRGHFKPCLEKDMKSIIGALARVGAHNLKEFRERVTLQIVSSEACKERFPKLIPYKK